MGQGEGEGEKVVEILTTPKGAGLRRMTTGILTDVGVLSPHAHEQQSHVISTRLENQYQIYLYFGTNISWILLISVNCESGWPHPVKRKKGYSSTVVLLLGNIWKGQSWSPSDTA